MTTVVLVVLAGIWIAVIAVPLVRAKAHGKLGDSIGSFRRHLSVLERAAPFTVAPANRMRLPHSTGVIGPYRPPNVSARAPRTPMSPSGAAAARRRMQAQKRRRDVLMGLMVAMFGSALLAMISGLSLMWAVNVVIDLLFVGYVALLVRLRNAAAEQDMRRNFQPGARPVPIRAYADGHSAPAGMAELARRAAAS